MSSFFSLYFWITFAILYKLIVFNSFMFWSLTALHTSGRTAAGNQQPYVFHTTDVLAIIYVLLIRENEICEVNEWFSHSGRPPLEKKCLMNPVFFNFMFSQNKKNTIYISFACVISCMVVSVRYLVILINYF